MGEGEKGEGKKGEGRKDGREQTVRGVMNLKLPHSTVSQKAIHSPVTAMNTHSQDHMTRNGIPPPKHPIAWYVQIYCILQYVQSQYVCSTWYSQEHTMTSSLQS